jgi:hypothetical protein
VKLRKEGSFASPRMATEELFSQPFEPVLKSRINP